MRACPCGPGFPLQVLVTLGLWAFRCNPSRIFCETNLEIINENDKGNHQAKRYENCPLL